MKFNKKTIVSFILSFIIFSMILGNSAISNNIQGNNDSQTFDLTQPKSSDFWTGFTFIHITGANWSTAAGYDWCSGNGTYANPYVIENITINAGTSPTGSGILIQNSDAFFKIRNCTIINAGVWPAAGIRLDNANNGTLIENNLTLNQGPGIVVYQSSNNTIFNNTAINNSGYGIILAQSNENRVLENYAYYNRQDGIRLYLSDLNNVSYNTVEDNDGDGFYVQDSYWNDFIGNEIIFNDGRGFHMYVGDNNEIIGNNLTSNNNRGILLASLSGSECLNNNISSNVFENNNGYGIDIQSYSDNNLFYNNSFINTIGTHARDNGASNTWDLNGLGNYWDDYTGYDLDNDGIGDTPYSISGGSQDLYPIWDDGNHTYWNMSPISIDGDGANNWTWAKKYEWCNGAGTWSDPYIIENVTIDANDAGYCIRIVDSSAYFIIRNCTLYDASTVSGYNIYCDNVNNGTIYNNTCYDSRYGLWFDTCRNFTIEDNIIHTITRYGMYIYLTETSEIINNTVTASQRDIGLYNSQYINMSYNKMLSSGLWMWTSILQTANTHNIDTTNTLNGKIVYYYKNENNLDQNNFTNAAQIFLGGCSNSNITNINITTGIRAISLHHSTNIIVSNCNITSNSENGIYLQNSDNNVITNNYIQNPGNGVELYYYSDNNNITNNNIYDTVYGVYFYYICVGNRIINNDINRTAGNGILLSYQCDNSLIDSNNVTLASNHGIELRNECDNCNITKNIIKDGSSDGININDECNSNEIWENAIINNDIGLSIENPGIESNLNLIYNNTFEANNLHGFDDCSNNNWNNSIIGNSWDNTTDADDDGLPDIYNPYPISGAGNAIDYLPWRDDGDDNAPTITLVSPSQYFETKNAPLVNVTFYDYYGVNDTWYQYLGYSGNISLSGNAFQVDPTIWSQLQGGSLLTIRIYANDTSGQENYVDLIIKKTGESPPDGIPWDLIVLIVVGCSLGIGALIGIGLFLRFKKNKRVNN
ncbi:MAG: NosD domain-containing protein [Promethearchaeota archaeon]